MWQYTCISIVQYISFDNRIRAFLLTISNDVQALITMRQYVCSYYFNNMRYPSSCKMLIVLNCTQNYDSMFADERICAMLLIINNVVQNVF